MATVHYHFGEFGEIRPYVGLGTGVYFTTQLSYDRSLLSLQGNSDALEMGLYRIIQKDTQFGLAPMAGVAIPLNKDTNFNIGAIYNWALETKKQQAVTSVGFNLGIGWRFY